MPSSGKPKAIDLLYWLFQGLLWRWLWDGQGIAAGGMRYAWRWLKDGWRMVVGGPRDGPESTADGWQIHWNPFWNWVGSAGAWLTLGVIYDMWWKPPSWSWESSKSGAMGGAHLEQTWRFGSRRTWIPNFKFLQTSAPSTDFKFVFTFGTRPHTRTYLKIRHISGTQNQLEILPTPKQ